MSAEELSSLVDLGERSVGRALASARWVGVRAIYSELRRCGATMVRMGGGWWLPAGAPTAESRRARGRELALPSSLRPARMYRLSFLAQEVGRHARR